MNGYNSIRVPDHVNNKNIFTQFYLEFFRSVISEVAVQSDIWKSISFLILNILMYVSFYLTGLVRGVTNNHFESITTKVYSHIRERSSSIVLADIPYTIYQK